MEKFPIFKACFSANGEEVLATSMHSKVIYVYDMIAGKLIPVHQVRGKTSVEHTVIFNLNLPVFISMFNPGCVCVSVRQADRVSLCLPHLLSDSQIHLPLPPKPVPSYS